MPIRFLNQKCFSNRFSADGGDQQTGRTNGDISHLTGGHLAAKQPDLPGASLLSEIKAFSSKRGLFRGKGALRAPQIPREPAPPPAG